MMTIANPLVKTKRFIITMFLIGSFFGLMSAAAYVYFMNHYHKWDASYVFQTLVLFWGLAFVLPSLTISLRIMFLGIMLNLRALDDYDKLSSTIDSVQKQIEPIVNKINHVVDRAVPIAESVQEIVEKSKQMSEDIGSIAQKTRTVLDNMNGSFDVRVLEKKMDKLADSLAVIASVFTNGKKEIDEIQVGEFDPLKLGKSKRKN